ncbi:MAG: RelA/SpoT family protein [Rikenellaceae bacterium]
MSYSASDDKLLAEAWGRLSLSCEKICRGDEDWDLIRRAYRLAKEAHEGVRRRTGEPYLVHPIAVAQIVVDEIGLGVKSVVAALLHDVVEDTHYTVEDISSLFGDKIASMVDGLSKISGVFNRETSQQAEYFRKMLLTMCDDVRVILIKIADRLHNMRTLGVIPLNKQIKITSETIYLFAPLAYRLGLFSIKSELEDLCLKYRFPTEYERITNKLSQTKVERDKLIELFTEPIIEGLDAMGLKYEISGRVKSPYSIWNKMQRKGIDFEEIYDLFAVRIVFQPAAGSSEKSQCWQIYSLITDYYAPNTERLRDWVSIPKDNGYEALHITVMGDSGEWVEVQIRTKRMDEVAERGLAAHWKYKQTGEAYEDDEFEKWLSKIRTALSSASDNAVDFLDDFKLSLYTSDIVVFTPKGEQRKLPANSTAIDFAYDIHSKIGNKAIGAKINHKVQSITDKIHSGDQIEIITSDTARPSAEWLDIVATSKAASAIKSFLKSERENNIECGKQLFEQRMSELQTPISGRVIRKVLPAYGSANKDEFYSKVGSGIITLDNLSQILNRNSELKILKFWNLFINRKSDDGGDADAADDVELEAPDDDSGRDEFIIAECCKPIPGDDVVGYRDPFTGDITVHKSTCMELHRLAVNYGQNIVKEGISWAHQKSLFFLTKLDIRGFDRVGLLRDLVQVVSSDFNINIREINISSHDGIFEGMFTLYVYDAKSLSSVIKRLRAIRGFESVTRKEF